VIWLRSSLFIVGASLAVLVYWPVVMLAWPLPPIPRSRIIGVWAHAAIWWLKVTCGLSYRVSGIENVPGQPCVLLSKHESAWETIAVQVLFPPQAWVLKRELLRVPFFGWALAASGPIAIDRSAARKSLDQLMRQGVERLRDGRFVVIFPEGTRTLPGVMGKFNPGGAMLAVKAGVPVVPVAHNAGSFWKRRDFLKYPGVIDVRVGPAIDTEGRSARDVNDQASAWIAATIKELEPPAAIRDARPNA
jgi:1-acyl-sn-glycerol-3-phosphate acyltransferase